MLSDRNDTLANILCLLRRRVMASKKKIIQDLKYGFPNFTSESNSVHLCNSNKLIISDIWSFWDYVIKKNGFDKVFMSSLLEQAKFFYEAAEKSPIKSQPLLYYYSFLNFAKIAINLKLKYGRTGCSYMHGISQSDSNKFSNATIEIKQILSPPHKNKNVSAELERLLNENTILSKLELNVKQLLNHCVGIHRTYSEIYSQKEIFCKIQKEELTKCGKELIFEADVKCNEEEFNSLLSIGYNIVRDNNKFKLTESYVMPDNNVTRKSYYELSKILRNKGLWYYIGKDGYVNYLSISNISRYSPEFIIYNAMFYFGSITRYHPYLFDEIFSAKEQWLMGEFLTTQPKQFLYLTTAKILSQDVLRAYADF
jgi:hypothetical protein